MIILTACLTAFVGIIVFVVGQLIQRIIIEPLQDQRRLIARAAHTIIYYRGFAVNGADGYRSDEKVELARKAVKEIASEFRASLKLIPWYSFLVSIGLALDFEKVKKVSLQFERWALFMTEHAINGAIDEITNLLDLDIKDSWDEFQVMMGVEPHIHESGEPTL